MAYNPSKHTASNKPYGVKGKPDGARTYFYDEAFFKYRPFKDTIEVLAYFVSIEDRKGHYLIVVNEGGTLLGGEITGGTNDLWWFKNGYTDDNLVLFNSELVRQVTQSFISTTINQVDFILATPAAFVQVVKNGATLSPSQYSLLNNGTLITLGQGSVFINQNIQVLITPKSALINGNEFTLEFSDEFS